MLREEVGVAGVAEADDDGVAVTPGVETHNFGSPRIAHVWLAVAVSTVLLTSHPNATSQGVGIRVFTTSMGVVKSPAIPPAKPPAKNCVRKPSSSSSIFKALFVLS